MPERITAKQSFKRYYRRPEGEGEKRVLFLKTGAHKDSEGMKDGGKWREKDIAYRWATDLLSLLLLLVS